MDDADREQDAERRAHDEAEQCRGQRDPAVIDQRAPRGDLLPADRLVEIGQDLMRRRQHRALHAPGVVDQPAEGPALAVALVAVDQLRRVEPDRGADQLEQRTERRSAKAPFASLRVHKLGDNCCPPRLASRCDALLPRPALRPYPPPVTRHFYAGALALALGVAACGGGRFSVLPIDGEPADIALVQGDGQSGRVGEALPQPLVFEVTDLTGRPVSGAAVVVAVPGADPSPDTATTGAMAGRRSASFLAPRSAVPRAAPRS